MRLVSNALFLYFDYPFFRDGRDGHDGSPIRAKFQYKIMDNIFISDVIQVNDMLYTIQ